MDDTLCRRFFLEPTQPLHRRFAVLHAFFVEGLSASTIAQRYGVTYHTVRAWVRDFRAQCRAGQIPPFSPNRPAADRRVRPRSSRHGRKNRLSPTAAKSA
jgi:transposase-like protein